MLRRSDFCEIQHLLWAGVAALLITLTSHAQTNYLLQTGAPTFTTAEPVEMGLINASNGNLHLEIPLTSSPQRGKLGYTAKLVYDSRIWESALGVWHPDNVAGSTLGGWRLVTSADPGIVSYQTFHERCNGNGGWLYTVFRWTAPDGTERFFNISTGLVDPCSGQFVSTGSAMADDSSGYYMTVTNNTQAIVYDKSGTVVHDDTQSASTLKDSNGNYFSGNGSSLVDTLGRTPVTSTSNSNTTTYQVWNSQGARSNFTVITESINVSTAFGQSGITEYSGTMTVIQSIGLPDGTSYSFGYDSGTTAGHYGLLTGITLPGQGTVTYGYTTFADSNGNRNRWVSSRVVNPGGTWTYTPAANVTCPASAPSGSVCQKVTVGKPSGDETVYTFILNNGGWNAQAQYYSGSSTLLATVADTYDFSQPGSQYIRKLTETTSLPSTGSQTLQKQVTYSYDSPQNGNLTAIKEWKYQTGSFPSTPDRETDISYVTNSSYTTKNIIDLPSSVTVKNSGATVAQTSVTYDSTSLTPAAGFTHHDDTSFGTGDTVRGNPTVIQHWVGGSTWLNTTLYYDTTGQVTKTTDPNGNPTTFAYTDQNAYPSQITNALNQYVTLGYDFNTGLLTSSTDLNRQPTTYSYDEMNRPTGAGFADGGSTSIDYPSATVRDVYTAITSGTSRHDQVQLDGVGRVIENILESDPVGADTVDTRYDSSGRVQYVSNPYRSGSVGDTYAYDGLNRVTQVTHADSNSAHAASGASVGGTGVNTTQLCSASTYGLGYPTLVTDEAGHQRETWTDGLSRVIEVDEPDPQNSNHLDLNTCYQYDASSNTLGADNLTNIAQGSQSRTYVYDGLSRLTQATTPESGTTSFYYTTSGGGLCSGDPSEVCRRTDARSITTAYAYDALNRLTSKTYSDGTPTTLFGYDQTLITMGSTQFHITNSIGRLSWSAPVNPSDYPITMDAYSYDPLGRVAQYWQRPPSQSNPWETQYSYDLAGDAASWTHPAGFTIINTINAAQEITQMTSSLNDATHPGTLATMTYTPFGALSTLVNGCAGSGCTQTQETYVYNNRMQPTMIELGTPSNPTAYQCLVYNYYPNVGNPGGCAVPAQGGDNGGNVVAVFDQDKVNTSLSHTEAYSYDALNRLTNAVATGNSTYNLTFSYDRYGNMTCTLNGNTSGYCAPYSFNQSNNQLTTPGFSYDGAGDLTQDPSTSPVQGYQWDAEGRLAKVTQNGSTYYTAVHDALGREVETDWPSFNIANEELRDAAGRQIGGYDAAHSQWYDRDIWLGGRVVAQLFPSDTYFLHADRLGSDMLISDHSGAMPNDWVYYPWGDWTHSGGAVDAHFAGFEEGEGPNYNTPARTYSGGLGRWLSPDPLAGDISNPQSLNRYAYALNNPTTRTDPSGMSPSPGGDFCPPESGQCFNIPTPGAFNPYAVVGPGGGLISTGSLIGTTSFDMAQGEANYLANNCINCVTVIYGNSSQEYSRQFESLDAYYDWVTDPNGGLPILAAYNAYQAYLLDCQYATTPCGVNDKVSVTTTGVTTNAQLPGNAANVASLVQSGYRDPTNAFHKGHNSWFIGFWGLFGFNEGHVVADPSGIVSHYDDFGPFNPLHYVIQLPLGVFNTGQVPYTCSIVGGCSP